MPCVEVLDISKSLEDSLYVHGRCTVIFDFWQKKNYKYVYEIFHWKMHWVLYFVSCKLELQCIILGLHCEYALLRYLFKAEDQDANIVHRYKLPALKYYMYLWSVQDAWGELHAPFMIQLMQYAFVGWYVCIYAQFHRILQGIHGMGLVLSHTSMLYANQCSYYHNLLHYGFFFQNTMRAQCPAPGFRTRDLVMGIILFYPRPCNVPHVHQLILPARACRSETVFYLTECV